jgi:endogenous inhibitor of DNA gyrase (YacG/DUF329 family)
MTNQHLCPICRRPLNGEAQELRFRPFCSRRCADVDLGRWLKGSYAIPAVETDGESEDGGGRSEGQDQEGGGRPVKH